MPRLSGIYETSLVRRPLLGQRQTTIEADTQSTQRGIKRHRADSHHGQGEDEDNMSGGYASDPPFADDDYDAVDLLDVPELATVADENENVSFASIF